MRLFALSILLVLLFSASASALEAGELLSQNSGVLNAGGDLMEDQVGTKTDAVASLGIDMGTLFMCAGWVVLFFVMREKMQWLILIAGLVLVFMARGYLVV